MIGSLIGLAMQAVSAPAAPEQVMTCYMQEDDVAQRDATGHAHLVGPKYLIAWKYRPLAAYGISKAPMEVHDPHGFLKGRHFIEQNYNAQGSGFFAGEPNKDQFVIGVTNEMVGDLHKAQFIHIENKKVTGMAFGYCKADEREAGEAFAFWQAQPETLP